MQAAAAHDPQADRANWKAPEHIALIRERYIAEARGNREQALDLALSDALADMCEIERHSARRERLISRGFAREPLRSRRVLADLEP